jgi:hypothetical protein
MVETGELNLCPWCGNKLEEGTFQSRGGNYFLPKNKDKPRFYTKASMDKSNAISLPPDSISLPIEYPKAYTCRTCRKIVIPY